MIELDEKDLLTTEKLLHLIRDSGYKIENIDIHHSSRYLVPRFVYVKVRAPEYNRAVNLDETISDNSRYNLLDR